MQSCVLHSPLWKRQTGTNYLNPGEHVKRAEDYKVGERNSPERSIEIYMCLGRRPAEQYVTREIKPCTESVSECSRSERRLHPLGCFVRV